jgi:rhodanese-related sulfurtransferase
MTADCGSKPGNTELPARKENPMTNEISYEELSQKIRAGARLTLVEVLPEKYFASGHLPKAINLPLSSVPKAAAGLLPDPGQELVLYCSGPTCSNSHVAARELAQRGYANVRVFSGGKETWVAAGNALEVTP